MKRLIILICCTIITACTPQLTNPATLNYVTAVPTVNADNAAALCESVLSAPLMLQQQMLETLYTQAFPCDNLNTSEALTLVYLQRAQSLVETDIEAAIDLYQRVLAIEAQNSIALTQLTALGQLTPVNATLPGCTRAILQQIAESPLPYQPTDTTPLQFNAEGFSLAGERWPIFGVNYYPQQTPFTRFLTQTEPNALADELTLLRKSGINTLRIFLRYDDLFICPANGAIPHQENFQRLDALIAAAAAHDLRVIAVMHQDADLQNYPLYEGQAHLWAQTRFLAERYRDEATLIAWDIRDKGDEDYHDGAFSRDEVLTWVADTVTILRDADPNHPITAGWWRNSLDVAPLVDFVSLQHYGEHAELRQEIANLRAATDKPILLTAIGYSTNDYDETIQRNLLFQAFDEVAQNELMGWNVYMAFDYPLTALCELDACTEAERSLARHGLWNTSYFPKLAVDAVRVATGIEETP